MSTTGSDRDASTDGADLAVKTGDAHTAASKHPHPHGTPRSGLAATASEAKFRILWGVASRLEPFIHMASRLAPSGRGRRQDQAKPTIPRRWYISHIFFWVGSGTACWFQFRRTDRAAARRHLLRSIWIPPLVWLAALTAVGTAIPDEAVMDLVRSAPYARAP